MSYAIAYIVVLIVFGAIDAVWLSTMGPLLYRPALGDILAQNLRIAPAIAFYLSYPIGVVVFAVSVRPALFVLAHRHCPDKGSVRRDRSVGHAQHLRASGERLEEVGIRAGHPGLGPQRHHLVEQRRAAEGVQMRGDFF